MVCIASLALHGCTRDDAPLDGSGVSDTSDDIVQVGFRIRLNDGYGTQAARTRADAALLPPDYNDPTKYLPGTGTRTISASPTGISASCSSTVTASSWRR